MKNIRIFLSEKLSFSVVKCSVYFNRRVFVMVARKELCLLTRKKNLRFSLVSLLKCRLLLKENIYSKRQILSFMALWAAPMIKNKYIFYIR